MAEEVYEDRTEPATAHKRREVREKGRVVRSLDLNSAVILLAAVLALEVYGREFVGGLLSMLKETLGGLEQFEPGNGREMSALLLRMAVLSAGILAPVVISVVVAALAVNLVQVGFLMTGESLTPDFDRLNPVTGLQRIFSGRGFARLAAGCLKMAVITVVLGVTLWNERMGLVSLSQRELEGAVAFFASILFTVSIRAALALLVLALIDYGYQRWQFEKDIRMSRHEIREEMKRYEGDPKIRERRRVIQRQLAMQRMMANVPKAAVVVTNPTEISVALEYDAEKMEAPVVVAKGAEHLALRIREIAMENRVPIVQRPEVARALYKSAEVGQTIPYELFQAVAEILAIVYRMPGAASVA